MKDVPDHRLQPIRAIRHDVKFAGRLAKRALIKFPMSLELGVHDSGSRFEHQARRNGLHVYP
jgi:hypothetical protein